jgi:hypothetical protein
MKKLKENNTKAMYIYFRLKMAIRPKHVAVTKQNIQTSVALDENPQPDIEFSCDFNSTDCSTLIIIHHLGLVHTAK